jgi:hypothetical protein
MRGLTRFGTILIQRETSPWPATAVLERRGRFKAPMTQYRCSAFLRNMRFHCYMSCPVMAVSLCLTYDQILSSGAALTSRGSANLKRLSDTKILNDQLDLMKIIASVDPNSPYQCLNRRRNCSPRDISLLTRIFGYKRVQTETSTKVFE